MAIGDRIRIISEEEYLAMSPPRRPRGEKPQTTIRFLHRQIRNMEAQLLAMRHAAQDQDTVIAGYDVQLNEANDIAREATRRAEAAEYQANSLRDFIDREGRELAFLRGYYAKSQETAPPHQRPISAEGASIVGYPAETHAGGRSDHSQDYSHERQAAQGSGIDQNSPRPSAGTGQQVRGEPPRHQTYQGRRPVEHIAIKTENPDWGGF